MFGLGTRDTSGNLKPCLNIETRERNWRETLHFSTLKSAISNLHPVKINLQKVFGLATRDTSGNLKPCLNIETRERNWRETLHFSTLKSAISNLHPVNDSSEGALAMATSFNGRVTRDEESYQDMMLVVAAHRKKYGFKKKEDLKNFV